MQFNFEKQTDGVWLLCSKEGLKNYFLDKDFNYDFPEGVLPLVDLGIAIAIVTETCEEVQGQIINTAAEAESYDLISEQNFYVAPADEVYILSHAEFTLICDNYKGDIDGFEFWNPKIIVPDLAAGWHKAAIFAKVIDNDEDLFLQFIVSLIHRDSQANFDAFVDIPAV